MNAPFLRSQTDLLRGSPHTLSRREAVIRFLLDHGLLVALIVEIGIFSLASPTIFFSRENFFTILRLSAATGITVAFYTMALIAGQIDLSTPQVGGLSAVIFAWMFWDFIRINTSYGEDVLLSSREGVDELFADSNKSKGH